MKGDQLKLITNIKYNVVLASLSNKNMMFVSAKKIYFEVKAPNKKSTRDRTLLKKPKPGS